MSITDDLAGIDKFVSALQESWNENRTIGDNLAHIIGLEEDENEFVAAVFLVQKRFSRLIDLIDSFTDEDLHHSVKSSTIAEIKWLKENLALKKLYQQGKNVKWTQFNQGALMGTMPILRRKRPLKSLTEEECKKALKNLANILETKPLIEESLLAPLIEGIDLLRITLLNLNFFGYQSFIEQLIELKAKTQVVEQSQANKGNHELLKWIGAIYMAIDISARLFVLPKEISDANQHYIENGFYEYAVDDLAAEDSQPIE